MKYFLGFILVLLFSLFQVVFLPVNIVLAIVYIMSFSLSVSMSLIFSFLAGLVFDLVVQSRLGVSSLAFLGVSLLLATYRHRFSFLNPAVIIIFFLIAYILFSFVTNRPINLVELVVLLFVVFFVRIIRPNMFDIQRSQIRL